MLAAARGYDGDLDPGKLFLKTGIGDRIANFRKAIENDLSFLLRRFECLVPLLLPRRFNLYRQDSLRNEDRQC